MQVGVVNHELIRSRPKLLPHWTGVEPAERRAPTRWFEVATDPDEPLRIVSDTKLADDVHAEPLLGLEEVFLEVLDEGIDPTWDDFVVAELDELLRRLVDHAAIVASGADPTSCIPGGVTSRPSATTRRIAEMPFGARRQRHASEVRYARSVSAYG